MRNKNSKIAATKLHLCKCDGVCITYSKIQYAYDAAVTVSLVNASFLQEPQLLESNTRI